MLECIQNNYFTEMCSGSEEGSYLRLVDFASLNSRLESVKEEERLFTEGAAPPAASAPVPGFTG